MTTILTIDDYRRAASELKCEVESIRSVSYQESAGNGYNPDGSIKILFEAHIFGWRSGQKFNLARPDLSVPGNRWDLAKPYYNLYWKRPDGMIYFGSQQNPADVLMTQWQRYKDASALDAEAAACAISLGYFQICGFNAVDKKMYPSARAYVADCLQNGAQGQLESFIRFCKIPQLSASGKMIPPAEFLAGHDWANFAYQYNGPGYAQNRYDTNLAVFYNFYKTHPQA